MCYHEILRGEPHPRRIRLDFSLTEEQQLLRKTMGVKLRAKTGDVAATPIPGTALHAEHVAKGTLLTDEECPEADAHGQLRFNFRHPHIHDGQETEFLLRAFRRDYEVNGPSILRIARTLLAGWQRHRDHPEARVRERYRRECRDLATVYAGALWAARRWFEKDPEVSRRIRGVGDALTSEFGWKGRLAGPMVGSVLLAAMRRERRRIAHGRTYEPPTFYETNGQAGGRRGPDPCRSVTVEA